MRNSSTEDVVFIWTEFRNVQYNSIQTENIQFAHVWQNLGYKIFCCMFKFCFILNYCVFCFFKFLQFALLHNQKKWFFHSLQKQIKKFNIRSSLMKFQEASKSTFMLFCSNFYAVLFFFIFEIWNNFKIPCQENEFILKVEFTP